MLISIKRVYNPAESSDGLRILVDRLWPRGISKEFAMLDYWAKEISPSDELRKWYSHDSDDWPEFKRLYFEELDSKLDEVKQLLNLMKGQRVTLVYSSKAKWNNALALKEYLETRYTELEFKLG
jgi:uncharacterized protein YeaO (DUF488 family)